MREILGKLKEMWLLDIGQRRFIFTHPEKALIVEDDDEYKKIPVVDACTHGYKRFH